MHISVKFRFQQRLKIKSEPLLPPFQLVHLVVATAVISGISSTSVPNSKYWSEKSKIKCYHSSLKSNLDEVSETCKIILNLLNKDDSQKNVTRLIADYCSSPPAISSDLIIDGY